MTTHRVEVEKIDARRCRLWYAGAPLGVTTQPLYGGARMLIESRLAEPSDLIEIVAPRPSGEDVVLGRTLVGAAARLASGRDAQAS